MTEAGRSAAPDSDRDERLRRHRRRTRFRIVGWVLVAFGAAVAVTHWVAHLGGLGGQPNLTWDVLAGYPAGLLLILFGFILVGQ